MRSGRSIAGGERRRSYPRRRTGRRGLRGWVMIRSLFRFGLYSRGVDQWGHVGGGATWVVEVATASYPITQAVAMMPQQLGLPAPVCMVLIAPVCMVLIAPVCMVLIAPVCMVLSAMLMFARQQSNAARWRGPTAKFNRRDMNQSSIRGRKGAGLAGAHKAQSAGRQGDGIDCATPLAHVI